MVGHALLAVQFVDHGVVDISMLSIQEDWVPLHSKTGTRLVCAPDVEPQCFHTTVTAVTAGL